MQKRRLTQIERAIIAAAQEGTLQLSEHPYARTGDVWIAICCDGMPAEFHETVDEAQARVEALLAPEPVFPA